MTQVDRGTQKRYVYKIVDSPVGRLTLVATDDGLAAILWENDRPRRVRLNLEAEDDGHPVLLETERQLGEYFAGRRKAFALTLDVAGTPFQRKVWNALLTIPFGETRSYGQIASQIGSPSAVRAVGRGQRQESRLDRRAVPSRHRIDRQAHRVRRRARRQGPAAGPGGRDDAGGDDFRGLTGAPIRYTLYD